MKNILLYVSGACLILAVSACNVDDESPAILNNDANNGTTPTNNGTVANNGTTPTNNGTTPTNNGVALTRVSAQQNCAGGGVATGGGYISIHCSGPAGASGGAATGGDYKWEPGASKVIFE